MMFGPRILRRTRLVRPLTAQWRKQPNCNAFMGAVSRGRMSQCRPLASLPPGFPRPQTVMTGKDGYQRFHQSSQPFYMSKRLWVFVGTGVFMFGGYYATHLEKVPISGRMRFMDVTPRQEEAMAKQAYQEVMSQYGLRVLPPNHPYTRFVSRVAKRIVQVSGMDDLQWEFHVIDSPEPK